MVSIFTSKTDDNDGLDDIFSRKLAMIFMKAKLGYDVGDREIN